MNYPQPPPTRQRRIESLTRDCFDVLVVGGGITGSGLALDLAARGLSVALVERGDWAGSTSSSSSRLIHGGLRYLEQHDFALVRESCLERGRLLKNAAGLVWPERFVFPVRRGGPIGRIELAAGLALYTLLSIPSVLGLPRIVSRREVLRRVPGIDARGLRGGGSYLDGATDDARLTLAVVSSAIRIGACCLSRIALQGLKERKDGVHIDLQDRLGGNGYTARARAVALCGGPFTDELRARAGLSGNWLQPARGTHVLVPRARLPTDGAVILTSPVDGRVMFLIPWARRTAIGTTDLFASPSEEIRATGREVRYLLDSANALVPKALLSAADVVSTWAGLRPLLAASQSAPSGRSREERIVREGALYTIAGGKLTGYRAMAEKLGRRLARDLGQGERSKRSPTRSLRLHGALSLPAPRPHWSSLDESGRPPEESAPIRDAWTRRYGALSPAVMDFCGRCPGGRAMIGPETMSGEVDWAVRFEDALLIEDVLLRRTDLAFEPREKALQAVSVVAERMAGILGWDRLRREQQEEGARERIERKHAWRGDPV